MIKELTEILKYNNIEEKIDNVYPYGSFVYGTNNEKSDHDYVIILHSINDQDGLCGVGNHINITTYNPESFQEKLNQHKIGALECFFLPKEKIIQCNINFKFKLDKSKLREVISEKVSHSWVKAKKKFEIIQDKDIYRGKKSLFHSLRIADFGIQIASKGKIENYSASNSFWKEIYENPSEEWDDYEKLYKKIHNNLLTEFRKVCPK